jgi:hypothetical protein
MEPITKQLWLKHYNQYVLDPRTIEYRMRKVVLENGLPDDPDLIIQFCEVAVKYASDQEYDMSGRERLYSLGY